MRREKCPESSQSSTKPASERYGRFAGSETPTHDRCKHATCSTTHCRPLQRTSCANQKAIFCSAKLLLYSAQDVIPSLSGNYPCPGVVTGTCTLTMEHWTVSNLRTFNENSDKSSRVSNIFITNFFIMVFRKIVNRLVFNFSASRRSRADTMLLMIVIALITAHQVEGKRITVLFAFKFLLRY